MVIHNLLSRYRSRVLKVTINQVVVRTQTFIIIYNLQIH